MKKNVYSFLLVWLFAPFMLAQAQTTELLNEGFSSGLGSMSAYSVTGSEKWENANYGDPKPCAKMSGAARSGKKNTNEDWLISPAINLTDYTSAGLSFSEAINYETNVAANCRVMVSTNYSGSGDPSLATWSEITMPVRSTGDNWNFGSTGTASLDAFAGNPQVYVAFVYTSTTSSAGTWEVDNVKVTTSSSSDGGSETDVYLDVVTYNIEWLGKPDKAGLSISRDEQITLAAQDILDAKADIYALQEIVIDDVNGDALTDLVAKLNSLDNTDSWAGDYNEYFSYWWDPDFANYPAQRQAFVYRNSTVKNVTFRTLLTDVVLAGDERFGSGRLPYLMEADVTIDGYTQHVYLVNLHLKCCRGNADRRKYSMQTLIPELDATYRDVNVFVLGDMNVADKGGAEGEIKDWGIYNDLDADSYADYEHAAGAKTDLSYDDIDHILISNELNDEFMGAPESLRNQKLSTRVSDHYPIKTTLLLQNNGTLQVSSSSTLMRDEPAINGLLYPNPFTQTATIEFTKESASHTSVVVYSVTGKALEVVADKHLDKGTYSLTIGKHLTSAGVYMVVVKDQDTTKTYRLIKK